VTWRIAGGRSLGACSLVPVWGGLPAWENPPVMHLPVTRAAPIDFLGLRSYRLEYGSYFTHVITVTDMANLRRPLGMPAGSCYTDGLENAFQGCTFVQLLKAERAGLYGWSYTRLVDLPIDRVGDQLTVRLQWGCSEGQTCPSVLMPEPLHPKTWYALRMVQTDGRLGEPMRFFVNKAWRGAQFKERLPLPPLSDELFGKVRINGGQRFQFDDDEPLELLVCGYDVFEGGKGGFVALINPGPDGRLPVPDDVAMVRTWKSSVGNQIVPSTSVFLRSSLACGFADLDADGIGDVVVIGEISPQHPHLRLLALKGLPQAPYFAPPIVLQMNGGENHHWIEILSDPPRVTLCRDPANVDPHSGRNTSWCSSAADYGSTVHLNAGPGFFDRPEDTLGQQEAGWRGSGAYRWTQLAEPGGSVTYNGQQFGGNYFYGQSSNRLFHSFRLFDFRSMRDGKLLLLPRREAPVWRDGNYYAAVLTVDPLDPDAHTYRTVASNYSLRGSEVDGFNTQVPRIRNRGSAELLLAAANSRDAVMLSKGSDRAPYMLHFHQDLETGAQTEFEAGLYEAMLNYNDSRDAYLSGDGRLLVVSGENWVRALDLDQPEDPIRWELNHAGSRIAGHQASGVIAMVSGDSSVRLVSETDGTLLWNNERAGRFPNGLSALALSDDGRWVAVRHDDEVEILSLSDGALESRFPTCSQYSASGLSDVTVGLGRMAFTADGESLVVPCAERILQHRRDGAFVRDWRGIRKAVHVAITADARWLMVYDAEKYLYKLPFRDASLGTCLLDDASRDNCAPDVNHTWGSVEARPHLRSWVFEQPDGLSDYILWDHLTGSSAPGNQIFRAVNARWQTGCGDGRVLAPEKREIGIWGRDQGDCWASCGDGVVDAWEDCDDGNEVDDDACNNACYSPLVQLAVSKDQTCAVDRAGAVFCWGWAVGSQTAEHPYYVRDHRDQQHRIVGLPPVRQVAVGGLARGGNGRNYGGTHGCALTRDDRVYCWGGDGSNQRGPLQAGRDPVFWPAQVDGLPPGLSQIEINGLGNVCVLTQAGAAWCWGDGYTPLGALVAADRPTLVPAISGATAMAYGNSTWCFENGQGQHRCWGLLHAHGLHVAGGRNSAPAQFLQPGGHHVQALDGMTGLSLSDTFGCGVTAQAEAACWGLANWNRTGVEENHIYHALRAVPGLEDVVQVTTAKNTSCARQRDGQVLCWGSGSHGQLGNNRSGDGYWEARPVPLSLDLTSQGGAIAVLFSAGARIGHGHLLTGSGLHLGWGHDVNYAAGRYGRAVNFPSPSWLKLK
jgi:cysteine-rich repeat protein